VLRRPPTALLALLAAGLVVAAAACDEGDGREMRPPSSAQRAAATTTTSSSTTSSIPGVIGGPVTTSPGAPTTTTAFGLSAPWEDGGTIDARFTCDGEDRSPLLTWTAPPAGTVEMALLVTDDDADGYVHWAVARIPPTAGEKGEGATITGATEGANDFGDVGWGGPCPPAGEPHTYRFSLYALSQQAELADDFTSEDLLELADSTAIAVAEVTGTYSR